MEFHLARFHSFCYPVMYVHTIHNLLAEDVCYYPRNTMFTELSLRCWSSRPRNGPRYRVSFSTVVFLVSYMHIHMPIKMYWLRLFFVVFREMHILTMTMFIRSQSFISLTCLLVLQLVRYASQTGTRRREFAKWLFSHFLGIYFFTRVTF